MDDEKDFLQYLRNNNITTFQTKTLSMKLKKELNVPKYKTIIWISILKTNKIIARKSVSGNCQTTCASCYENGCDAGNRPPLNFWERIKK